MTQQVAAIDLSNANPAACGHKEVRRSTGHIIMTTRYSDQQGSKSRRNVIRLYKQWYRPIKTVHQTSLLHIERNLDRLGILSPTHDQRSQQINGKVTLQPVLINKSKFLKASHCTGIRKIEIPRSMAGRPGSSEVPRNPLTRWDVSSIRANGIFLTKKLEKQK